MKRKKETILQKVKWFLFFKKLRLWQIFHELKYDILRYKHCKRGFHCFKNNYIGLTSYGKKRKREIRTDFHECRVCGLLIFTTKKDKKNWLLIKKQEKGTYKKVIDIMLKDMKKKK